MKITKIPSIKNQIPNKFQHAAQAPALRVMQIQNSKQLIPLEFELNYLSLSCSAYE
jgi:hypothetical protein